VRKIIVHKRRILLTHPGEILPNELKVVVRHVIEFDQSSPCTLDTTQQFVKLQGDNSCLSVLSVLDEEDHQEGDDRCSGVDEKLPGVRVVEEGVPSMPTRRW
jgi:hypothetical protein